MIDRTMAGHAAHAMDGDPQAWALLAIAEALNNVAEALRPPRPRRDSDMLRGMSPEQVRAWGEAVTGRGETS